jgi:hypothetical protein
MAPTIEDRYLWLGLGTYTSDPFISTQTTPLTSISTGVFTFLAAKAVAHGLRNILTLTEVHNPIPLPPQQLPATSSSAKEDAIKTSSLSTLATCGNIEIQRSATQILCDRFEAHPSAWRLLFQDLKSEDLETRHRADLALSLLAEYDVLKHIGHRHFGDMPPWLRSGGRPRGSRATARSAGARDPEERALRRRRREAMVINEGDRPISQEDVFMPDRQGRMSMEYW